MAATEGAIIADPLLEMSDYEGPGLLDLSNQGLHKLDLAFFSHGKLHTLLLDQNHIIKLEHLECNEALLQLSAACNRLVRMMGVSKLIHLRFLNLPNNSIGYIEGLKDLVHLEWLNLAGNNIKVIEQLNNCVSLQHLDLSDNNISQIGDLTKLSALKTLLLHGNIITTLRTAPAHLPVNLSVLSLAENEIRDLTEVSYLAPLHCLQQLSLMSNPCVMATPALPSCDYRPYVISWCLSLKLLDGCVVSQKEGLKAEWLYSQGKGRAFRPGQHAQLVQYLASTCPLTATTALQSAEDAKLERILNKQRQHQNQLQQTRPFCSSPSRPTHLDVHKNRDVEVIAQADVDPGVQVNAWMGSESSAVIAAVRLPPSAEDGMILEDVQTDEEKLHGSLLSSESAFLPFNTAVHPASAADSGEEEFEDSLAPPISTQLHPPEEESVTSLTHGSDQACSDSKAQQHALNSDGVLQNGSVEDSDCTEMQKAAVQSNLKQHEAAVRIQAWWRGHWTRLCHPQAKEVRAEIRLRRMQDHILHLTAELERVRKQQEEERLQRRVQEEAVKFLWKQLQVVLQWQSSVNEQLNAAQSSALDPSIPSETPVRTEISIPESGFHSPGERRLEHSLSSTAGSPETVLSLGPLRAAAGNHSLSNTAGSPETVLSLGPLRAAAGNHSQSSTAGSPETVLSLGPLRAAAGNHSLSSTAGSPETVLSLGPLRAAAGNHSLSSTAGSPETVLSLGPLRAAAGNHSQSSTAGSPETVLSLGPLRAAAGNQSLSSTAGSPETVLSLGPLRAATGDSLLEQYLSSVQQQEEEDKGAPSDLSLHGKQELLS